MSTKYVYRNNNLSFNESNKLPDSKKSELTKSGEDDEFEYYKVPKKIAPKEVKPEKSETIENNDNELIEKISLDNIPDIRDVSFNGKSLAGGSSLNLRF